MQSRALSRLLKIPNPNLFISRFFCSPPSTPLTSSSESLRVMVNDIFREQDLKKVVEKFLSCSEISRFRSKHRIYDVTVRRLASAKKFSDIEEIIETHKKYPDISNEGFAVRLITLYGEARMFDNAQKLFDDLPQLNCTRTVKSFNAILSAAVDSKLFKRVPEMFQHLQSDISAKPNLSSFNILINAYCKMGSLDDAVLVLETMKTEKIEPNVVTFNTLLNGFAGEGRIDDAEKMFKKMEECNVSPNLYSYNVKLRVLVSCGKEAEADELMKELKGKGLKPNAFSFNALMQAYCDNGNLEEAKKIYSNMLTNGSTPNRLTFETIIPSLCKNGEMDLAFKLSKDSISKACYLDIEVLQGVVDGLIKESKMEEAKNFVSSYKNGLKLPSSEEKSD